MAVEEIKKILTDNFPGLVFVESTTGPVTSLSTPSSQPIGVHVSVGDHHIVVELSVALGTESPRMTRVRLGKGASYRLLQEKISAMRASLVAWWGAIGDALGIGWSSDVPGSPQDTDLDAEQGGEIR